ncbi:MAG TPA: DNA primase [Micromonosporaceae bacterium]
MAAEEPAGRSAQTDALWADVRIDPVEIALPGGVGYTLRAYRSSTELAVPEIDRDAEPELDDFDAAAAAVVRRRRSDDDLDEDAEVDEFEELVEEADDEAAEAEVDEDAEADEDEDEQAEEVPVFLGRKGRIYLFHSPEKLVEFVRSGAEHDLTQLDSWDDVVARIRVEDVVAVPEDTYELDLVVDNLRGGPDAWDPALILKAGELARDLGFALRMEPLQVALASGSPLDDLDEALRTAEAGGVGAFFARRRLRKTPAQQASLAWRTIIGKISAVADWRD